mmetsp:Transcript_24456/g.39433  ORF Transcript_24456/g.39433 Transcript_24456/m.39433 type:complete len:154 (-) Transcript_24456:208-669(-)
MEDRNSRPSVAVSYVGVEASMRKLETYIAEKGPFDGILGFSQGGAAAAVLCAQNPHSFKFAVIISGFVPRDEALLKCLEEARQPLALSGLQSLHVWGTKDTLVDNKRSRELLDYFGEAAKHFEHTGGHFVPSGGEFRRHLLRFITEESSQSPT